MSARTTALSLGIGIMSLRPVIGHRDAYEFKVLPQMQFVPQQQQFAQFQVIQPMMSMQEMVKALEDTVKPKPAKKEKAHWDYHDFSAWPPLCQTTPDQSPINLPDSSANNPQWTKAERQPVEDYIDWKVYYSANSKYKVENNCHSLKITPLSDQPIATLSGPETNHTEYHLAQLHFHWGKSDNEGSEHTVGKESFPLEMHFVHYSSKFANLGEAVAAGAVYAGDGIGPNTLSVVGIKFDKGAANPGIDHLNIGNVKECKATQTIIERDLLADLIPDNVFADGYYAYKGSLTTPPCYDIVEWFLPKRRSTVSSKQLEAFRQLLDLHHSPIEENWRPVQQTSAQINFVTADHWKYSTK